MLLDTRSEAEGPSTPNTIQFGNAPIELWIQSKWCKLGSSSNVVAHFVSHCTRVGKLNWEEKKKWNKKCKQAVLFSNLEKLCYGGGGEDFPKENCQGLLFSYPLSTARGHCPCLNLLPGVDFLVNGALKIPCSFLLPKNPLARICP